MRNIMHFAATVILGIAFLPPAARADWQFTKWGMTLDQVVKASGGKATTTTAKENAGYNLSGLDEKVLLKVPYQSGALRFNAYFGFDRAGKLVSVTLNSLDKRANEIWAALTAKYGTARNKSVDSVSWYGEWVAPEENISFYCLLPLKPKSVNVNYIARKTSNSSGL